MSDNKNEILLEAGTPLLVVGFDKEFCNSDAGQEMKSLPRVYAGRLNEPHRPFDEDDKTFLFGQGPMALSIDPKSIKEKAFFISDSGTGVFILSCKENDANGCLMYFIVEDRSGVVDVIDGSQNLDWQAYTSLQQEIFRQTMVCYEDIFYIGVSPFTSP